ncbi:IS630 family transposase [Streptomyces sp. NPDC003006]
MPWSWDAARRRSAAGRTASTDRACKGWTTWAGKGRKRRITEEERSRIIALVKTVPPGRLRWEPVGELWAFDESGPAEWTLDSLAAAEGIEVSRSQVRRILLAEGVRWRRTRSWTRSWTRSKDPHFVAKGRGSSASTLTRPGDATVICADELGPVIPRTFPPAPAWSPDGRRIKVELDYSRGPERTWIYGALRVRDGQQITMTASSRNSAFYQQFLQQIEDANPTGQLWIVTDNLSSHNCLSTRTWLEDHPRIHRAFIPVGACWLNLQEGWWRIFRKAALAGQSFANRNDIEPPPPTRRLRRRYVYAL